MLPFLSFPVPTIAFTEGSCIFPSNLLDIVALCVCVCVCVIARVYIYSISYLISIQMNDDDSISTYSMYVYVFSYFFVSLYLTSLLIFNNKLKKNNIKNTTEEE